MSRAVLLVIDAGVNLALGLVLLLFPEAVAQWLGVPIPESAFYPSILGAVLIGIGLALLLERYRSRLGLAGLGFGGAIVINFCGASALVVWLIWGRLDLPIRGYVVLWGLAAIVLGIGGVELLGASRRRERPRSSHGT